MLKRTVPLIVLVALAIPAAATGKRIDVTGPIAVQGHAFVSADLQATDASRPVRMRLRAGFVRIVDLSGDLKVRCGGKAKLQTRKNARDQNVYLCIVRAGRLAMKGSHYRLFGFAMRYGLLIPEGVSGTLAGRFQECRVSDGKPACGKPSDPARPDDGNGDASAGLDQLDG